LGPANSGVSSGVYYLHVTLKNCDQEITLKGWVQVIRNGSRMSASDNNEEPLVAGDTIAYKDMGTFYSSEKLNQEFTISPNPSSGVFEFTLPDDTDKRNIIVFNSMGRKVKELPVEGTGIVYKLDMTSEENGLYIIQIRRGGKIINRKVYLDK
jgi:hypothetical protein